MSAASGSSWQLTLHFNTSTLVLHFLEQHNSLGILSVTISCSGLASQRRSEFKFAHVSSNTCFPYAPLHLHDAGLYMFLRYSTCMLLKAQWQTYVIDVQIK